MEEEKALVDRVLIELSQIIESEPNLNEFAIIPVMNNEKNTSPLVYENNSIGLEMWAVKYIIIHTKVYLMKMRNLIKKNLSDSEVQKVKRSLLGAVLVQPEVTTYWNMRKELLERGYLSANSELYFTKLVLSYKNKCNEAFTQRRWIFKKAMEDNTLLVANAFLNYEHSHLLLNNELKVAEMTSLTTKNNYHAWAHRIWSLQNIKGLSKQSFSVILASQYESSYDWLFGNVSEHSAFQYRQKLMTFLIKNREKMNNFFVTYEQFTVDHLKLNNDLNSLFINNKKNNFEDFKCLFSLLIYELFHTVKELNKSYPGHESIWYHRRFIIKTLFDEIFNFKSKNRLRINDTNLSKSECLISRDLNELLCMDNIIINFKLFKPEFRDAESIMCFNKIVKDETELIKTSQSLKYDPVQRYLADKYEKWLMCVLQVDLLEE
nr:protein prenyltransferase alpha subunit repeat-containing protein 1 [Onthophagus taurus]